MLGELPKSAEQGFQQDPPAGLFTSPKLPISIAEITEANVVQTTADVPQDKIEVNRSKKWEVPRLDQDKIQGQQSEAKIKETLERSKVSEGAVDRSNQLLFSVPEIVVMKFVSTRSSGKRAGQSPATHGEISH